IWMPAAVFIERACPLFDRAPINELRITQAKLRDLRQLIRCPLLSRLQTLDLSDRKLQELGAHRLTSAKVLRGLRVLRLRACNLTDNDAFEFARSPMNLEELDLSFNSISPQGLQLIRSEFGQSTIVRFDPPPSNGSVPVRSGR